MKIPKAKILKYAAMGIIAAFIATFFFKRRSSKGIRVTMQKLQPRK